MPITRYVTLMALASILAAPAAVAEQPESHYCPAYAATCECDYFGPANTMVVCRGCANDGGAYTCCSWGLWGPYCHKSPPPILP